jgi:hypothetical protein
LRARPTRQEPKLQLHEWVRIIRDNSTNSRTGAVC